MQYLLSPLVALLILAPCAHSFAARFYGLGDLPGGGIGSFARAVSGDGSTVVGQSLSGNGPEAVRWTIDSGLMGLGDLAGGQFYSDATDASYDGSVIVGTATTAPPIPAASGLTAFRWKNGAMEPIGSPALMAEAHGVSADGNVIVGVRSQATSEPVLAFRWEGGSIVNIGQRIDGRAFRDAAAVSADGTVTVGQGSGFAGFEPEAMRWSASATPSGELAGLGGLLPNSRSMATAISADGTMIVGQALGISGLEAAIFRPGGPRGLGDLPGGSFHSNALAVSGDGSVIVGEAQSDVGLEAFVWTEAMGMRSLHQLLVASGVAPTGWKLNSATDISDNGLVIVGIGTNPNGQTEGWVAILPEPSSMMLLSTAVVFVIRTRRRQPSRLALRRGCHELQTP